MIGIAVMNAVRRPGTTGNIQRPITPWITPGSTPPFTMPTNRAGHVPTNERTESSYSMVTANLPSSSGWPFGVGVIAVTNDFQEWIFWNNSKAGCRKNQGNAYVPTNRICLEACPFLILIRNILLALFNQKGNMCHAHSGHVHRQSS